MVLIRRRRVRRVRRNKVARSASGRFVRRSGARRRRRRRLNPRFGTHRPTLIFGRGGWRRPKRGRLIKRGTRINPRRRYRRNPRVTFRSLMSRENMMHLTAVAGGITVGLLGIPVALKVAPNLAAQRRWLGGVHLALGAGILMFARNRALKTAGTTVCALGLYDLISQNVEALGLPTLPDTTILTQKMLPAPTATKETEDADYMPVAADFTSMAADYGAIGELTF